VQQKLPVHFSLWHFIDTFMKWWVVRFQKSQLDLHPDLVIPPSCIAVPKLWNFMSCHQFFRVFLERQALKVHVCTHKSVFMGQHTSFWSDSEMTVNVCAGAVQVPWIQRTFLQRLR